MSGQYDPNVHHRRSIRLTGYDYSQSGFYFVTICVHDMKCLFGNIVQKEMRLNELGHIAEREWLATPEHRPYAVLHEFVVMPNHFHGIIEITGGSGKGVARYAPTDDTKISPKQGTLAAIIRAYKSAVTKSTHEINAAFVWQRNYHEHVIRNDEDYLRIAEYIQTNPLTWENDQLWTN